MVSTNPRDTFQAFNRNSGQGKWKLIFFWPKDFTFVCSAEIAGYGIIRFVYVTDMRVGRSLTESSPPLAGDRFLT